MTTRNPTDWMWAQACDMIDQAERMHRQFFRLAAPSQARTIWEPPVDIFEDDAEVVIVVALPGVAADSIVVTTEYGEIIVRAEGRLPSPARAGWCGGSRFPMATSSGACTCRGVGRRRDARNAERLPDPAAAQDRKDGMTMNNQTSSSDTPISADAGVAAEAVAGADARARGARPRHARCPTMS